MGSIKELFVKVNKDPAFRGQFLNDPAGTLKANGVSLSPAMEAELMALLPVVKKHLPDLSKVPMGYDPLLNEVDTGMQAGHTDDPSMLIL